MVGSLRDPLICYTTCMTIFEKIINREIPSEIIYEDDMCIGMLDINPATKGHTLIIPKIKSVDCHVDHIWLIPDKYYDHMWKVAKDLAVHIKEKLNVDRVGVMVEGYGVPHAHIHLIPLEGPHTFEVYPDKDRSVEASKLKETAELLRM